jgi:hypothetical protein
MPSCTSISCYGAWSMNEYDLAARTNSEMRSVLCVIDLIRSRVVTLAAAAQPSAARR